MKMLKKWLLLPLLLLPCMGMVYFIFKGRLGSKPGAAPVVSGINTQLPKALLDAREARMTKLEYYQKADADSLRKREYRQQDPYRRDSVYVVAGGASRSGAASVGGGASRPDMEPRSGTGAVRGMAPVEDRKADELLKQLEQFKEVLTKPRPYSGGAPPGALGSSVALAVSRVEPVPHPMVLPVRAAETDPQLERLSKLLDKVMQIQQSASAGAGSSRSALAGSGLPGAGLPETASEAAFSGHRSPGAELSGPRSPGADFSVTASGVAASGVTDAAEALEEEAIAAVVDESQTLMTGSTLALRLTEPVTIRSVIIPANQLLYGIVSINNDRLLVGITTIRMGRFIYSANLQAYDMDGLPGIHIPGKMSREVAKQSADQGLGSVNLTNFDPGLGTQAANVGIQTVKSLLSRKVRAVRALVPAGYQVLLRNGSSAGKNAVRVWRQVPDTVKGNTIPAERLDLDSLSRESGDSVRVRDSIGVMDAEDFPVYLHHSVKAGDVSLTLRGVYLRRGLLWFSLLLNNEGPVAYTPDYLHGSIRDRKPFKRMASQEIMVPMVAKQLPTFIGGESAGVIHVGFTPFSLPKGKVFVLHLAEKGGGPDLRLVIREKLLLNAK